MFKLSLKAEGDGTIGIYGSYDECIVNIASIYEDGDVYIIKNLTTGESEEHSKIADDELKEAEERIFNENYRKIEDAEMQDSLQCEE